jgi:hypothetical protein
VIFFGGGKMEIPLYSNHKVKYEECEVEKIFIECLKEKGLDLPLPTGICLDGFFNMTAVVEREIKVGGATINYSRESDDPRDIGDLEFFEEVFKRGDDYIEVIKLAHPKIDNPWEIRFQNNSIYEWDGPSGEDREIDDLLRELNEVVEIEKEDYKRLFDLLFDDVLD